MSRRSPFNPSRPKPSKRYPMLDYLKQLLLEHGVVLKAQPTAREIRLGPLTIWGVPQVQLYVARDRHKDRLRAQPGFASVLILGARDNPDKFTGAQVVMNIESFAQIVAWLTEGDPNSFLRPPTAKGMNRYDNDTTNRAGSRHEQAGVGRTGVGEAHT